MPGALSELVVAGSKGEKGRGISPSPFTLPPLPERSKAPLEKFLSFVAKWRVEKEGV